MSSVICSATAKDQGFLNRVKYFMQGKAVVRVVHAEATPEEIAYSKKILTGQASIEEYAMAAVTNASLAATIGGGGTPNDNDLSYVVQTEMWAAMVAANS
jgi:hypothetical protein